METSILAAVVVAVIGWVGMMLATGMALHSGIKVLSGSLRPDEVPIRSHLLHVGLMIGSTTLWLGGIVGYALLRSGTL